MNSNDAKPSDFVIRNVDIDRDAADITTIYNYYIINTEISFETEPLTVEAMKGRIAKISTRYPYIVAEIEGKIMGYAYVHEWNQRQAYAHSVETSIYLATNMHGNGIGSKLLDNLEKECLNGGFTTLVAQITANNSQSRKFHESRGYVEAGLLKRIGNKFGRMLDVAIYQRFLK